MNTCQVTRKRNQAIKLTYGKHIQTCILAKQRLKLQYRASSASLVLPVTIAPHGSTLAVPSGDATLPGIHAMLFGQHNVIVKCFSAYIHACMHMHARRLHKHSCQNSEAAWACMLIIFRCMHIPDWTDPSVPNYLTLGFTYVSSDACVTSSQK